MKTERKISTTVQLTNEQYMLLDKIVGIHKQRVSSSEIIRKSFDFYVEKKYPNLKKEI